MTYVISEPTPMTDDHGDQFPGALPARPAAAPSAASERHVRMRPAHVHRVDSAVRADWERTAVEESSAPPVAGDLIRRTAGRRSPARTHGGRPPGQPASTLSRMGRFTRRSLTRFDRYALDLFDPGAPYRPHGDR
jgi:hypothetical protein